MTRTFIPSNFQAHWTCPKSTQMLTQPCGSNRAHIRAHHRWYRPPRAHSLCIPAAGDVPHSNNPLLFSLPPACPRTNGAAFPRLPQEISNHSRPSRTVLISREKSKGHIATIMPFLGGLKLWVSIPRTIRHRNRCSSQVRFSAIQRAPCIIF